MANDGFEIGIAREIWERKYRLKNADGPLDQTLDDTFWRVARAAAAVEPGGKRVRDRSAEQFHASMASGAFLPGGRILAGAGSGRAVTLFNCFVMGRIEDDLGSIFDNLKEAALTMQAGGGIGHDFSTLRPSRAPVKSIGATASGPVSFMDVWDAMCRTIMSAGQRRGAMMATLRCDHPDIETFIAAKAEPGRLRNFNLSVLVSDAFIAAVKADGPWDLVFDGQVYRTVSARQLWSQITRANYAYAEPGVVFIDRVNAKNNLSYCEEIYATNPCGEQPLPAYGACLLGSVNLAQLIADPLTPHAAMDTDRLKATVQTAVRFLDNIIDISAYPLPQQAREAKAKRRIGLGVTGLADALIFIGERYGAQASLDRAALWMKTIQEAAYATSAQLAAEKGAFPLFDKAKMLERPNVRALPAGVRSEIERHGLRNGCLTSIAPTGTISLLAGNVSSGIEPVFAFRYTRRIKQGAGPDRDEDVQDYAHTLATARSQGLEPTGDAWVTASDLTPSDHLKMQAALQPHVDSAISKTINCPPDIAPEAFDTLYLDAFDLGLKGCTTFRPNAVTGSVLVPLASTAEPASPKPRAVQSTNQDAAVIYMKEPLARDSVLSGQTYKLKWPGSDHAFYVTINDIVRDGRRRPFEIFINTKDLTHFAWTVALTRMISAVFRRGGDVSFIADELKAIFDPQGGQWISGTYVPSLQAAIGGVIETHLASLDADEVAPGERRRATASLTKSDSSSAPTTTPSGLTRNAGVDHGEARPQLCPRCSAPGFRLDGRCRICTTCGHSSCG
jgi:ribonucleoside-diphosphate reductase alpha chain